MRNLRAYALCGVGLLGCTADTSTGSGIDKGVIDVEQMRENQPWPVTLKGDTASVKVPFLEPVPEGADHLDDPEGQLEDAISLIVKSDETGTTANITTGKPVASDPDKPGEFSWKLNEARDEATLTFFNEAADGLTLKTDRTYTVQVAVTENDYLGEVGTTKFRVQPKK